MIENLVLYFYIFAQQACIEKTLEKKSYLQCRKLNKEIYKESA